MTYSLKADQSGSTFQQVPAPKPLQAKAYEGLDLLPVVGNRILTYLSRNQQSTVYLVVELRVRKTSP
jgi:hypothetical protein